MPHVDGEDDGVGYGIFGHSLKGHGVRGSTGNAIFPPSVNSVGVYGSSSDFGVLGKSDGGTGVRGESHDGFGVEGGSNGAPGVSGTSFNDSGVRGQSIKGSGVWGESREGPGIFGQSESRGVVGLGGANSGRAKETKMVGVQGDSSEGIGVEGLSANDSGVHGFSVSQVGVFGESEVDAGVYGSSLRGWGVFGSCEAISGTGVYGDSSNGEGVTGESITGVGVVGESQSHAGVWGHSKDWAGVFGWSGQEGVEYPPDELPYGVLGRCFAANGIGVAGWSAGHGFAGYFDRDVSIVGNLEKASGSFKIDHPLDPANKYLLHSFVESPDMKNVYDGVVLLDDKGEAEIELPDWFGALNKDFRYQLAAIGAPGPNLYIAEEIKNQRFRIAGGPSGLKVCWQVTGIRNDPYANTHRIQVEEDKPAKQRGLYIHPELYGEPTEKGMSQLIFNQEKKKSPSLSKIKPHDRIRK